MEKTNQDDYPEYPQFILDLYRVQQTYRRISPALANDVQEILEDAISCYLSELNEERKKLGLRPVHSSIPLAMAVLNRQLLTQNEEENISKSLSSTTE